MRIILELETDVARALQQPPADGHRRRRQRNCSGWRCNAACACSRCIREPPTPGSRTTSSSTSPHGAANEATIAALRQCAR